MVTLVPVATLVPKITLQAVAESHQTAKAKPVSWCLGGAAALGRRFGGFRPRLSEAPAAAAAAIKIENKGGWDV